MAEYTQTGLVDFKVLPCGNVTAKFANGTEYIGTWSDPLRCAPTDCADFGTYRESWRKTARGKGTFKYPNNDIYTGEWLADKRHGYGITNYNSGAVYEGHYKNGLMNGFGRLTCYCGVYNGEFRNNAACGVGIYRSSYGDTYKGQFADTQKHGHGVYYNANGESYSGQWYRNTFKYGTKKQNGQILYKGQFGDIIDICGYGVMYYQDGATESGKFSYGNNLHYVYKYPNGDEYAGGWCRNPWGGWRDVEHGVYTRANGTSFTGTWIGGNLDDDTQLWHVSSLLKITAMYVRKNADKYNISTLPQDIVSLIGKS